MAWPVASAADVFCTPAGSESKPFLCTPVDAARERLLPVAAGRTAILAAARWRDVTLLQAGTDGSIDRARSGRTIALRLSWQSRAPRSALFSVTTLNHAWTWEEDREDLMNLRSVNVPPGRYMLRISAEGFEEATVPVDVTAAKSTDLGVIRILLRRIASGRVLDATTGAPLSGAIIRAGQSVSATTDAAGTFTTALPRGVLEITAEYPGHADAIVAIPEAGASGLRVMLDRAASLHVIIDRKDLSEQAVKVALLMQNDEDHWDVVAERTPAAKDSDAVFARLRRGIYRVTVRGAAPMAFFSTDDMELAAGDKSERRIRISPAHLALLVTLGETPLAGAAVELTNTEHGLKGTLSLDDGGRAATELWQPGTVLAAVRSSLLRTPHLVYRKLNVDPEISWHIAIPDLHVAGRVVDQKTGRGVRDANVLLATETSTSGTTVKQVTGSDGDFEFRGVLPGKQSLDVAAEGYLKRAPVEFALADGENRTIDIPLQSGAQREVHVRTPSGAPIANASILTVTGNAVISVVSADATGVARVPLPEDTSPMLIAAAPHGAFAVVRLSANDDQAAQPMDITIPDGSATLHLILRTTSDEPVAGIGFVVRFNGEMIPYDALAPAHLDMLTTNLRGESRASLLPPGDYDLWAYETPDEAILINTAPPRPTVSLSLHAGVNETLLKFEPK